MTEPSPTTSWPADWLRGVLELCVLSVLSAGPTYGYAVAQRLAEAGLGTVKGGTLYPLLTRLETEALAASSWREGDGGPGRKFFELTAAGSAELRSRTVAWNEFIEHARRLLPPLDAPPPTLPLRS